MTSQLIISLAVIGFLLTIRIVQIKIWRLSCLIVRQCSTKDYVQRRSSYLKLIFLYGLPGVGKLTVANELTKLTAFRVFHNHLAVDLALSLFEFGSPPFVELREKIWHDVFTQAVSANLDGLIFTFVFERTVSSGFIENTRRLIESADGEVLFVELTCSTEELESRIEEPSRKQFGKLSSVDQFRELKEAGAFVDPTIPIERLVVDTTELSATDAARLIANKLGTMSR